MNDILVHNEDDMRREDKAAQNAIAEAYGLEPPYSEESLEEKEQSKRAAELAAIKKAAQEIEAIRQANEEKNGRVEQLCAELEAVNAQDGVGVGLRIARAIAKAHGLGWRDFVSKRRWKHVTRARQHAMWEIHKATTLSLPAIARVLGGMDHTTVLYGIRAHHKRVESGEFDFPSGNA